jgi:arabinose-5-phosphate isomerase
VLEQVGSIRGLSIRAVMTGGPVTINASALAAEAVRLMEERRISVLLVSDDRARLTGALHLHDLLQAKVV